MHSRTAQLKSDAHGHNRHPQDKVSHQNPSFTSTTAHSANLRAWREFITSKWTKILITFFFAFLEESIVEKIGEIWNVVYLHSQPQIIPAGPLRPKPLILFFFLHSSHLFLNTHCAFSLSTANYERLSTWLNEPYNPKHRFSTTDSSIIHSLWDRSMTRVHGSTGLGAHASRAFKPTAAESRYVHM